MASGECARGGRPVDESRSGQEGKSAQRATVSLCACVSADDVIVSVRFALAYLRDILIRKRNVREELTEYNGGPAGRHPHSYRMVMGAYVEILERGDLRCRFRAVPKEPTVTTLLIRA